jgi:hypothetical protein
MAAAKKAAEPAVEVEAVEPVESVSAPAVNPWDKSYAQGELPPVANAGPIPVPAKGYVGVQVGDEGL